MPICHNRVEIIGLLDKSVKQTKIMRGPKNDGIIKKKV